jgi:hypothetical protein
LGQEQARTANGECTESTWCISQRF